MCIGYAILVSNMSLRTQQKVKRKQRVAYEVMQNNTIQVFA